MNLKGEVSTPIIPIKPVRTELDSYNNIVRMWVYLHVNRGYKESIWNVNFNTSWELLTEAIIERYLEVSLSHILKPYRQLDNLNIPNSALNIPNTNPEPKHKNKVLTGPDIAVFQLSAFHCIYTLEYKWTGNRLHRNGRKFLLSIHTCNQQEEATCIYIYPLHIL